MNIKNFENILEMEIALFQQLAQTERVVQEALIQRDFLLLDEYLEKSKEISEAIREIDHQRDGLYTVILEELGIEREYGITFLLASLEGSDRERMANLYRELKITVLQVKNLTSGINAFSTSKLDSMHRMLDELYPHRRAKTYRANGTHHPESEPMVLDHTL
jgi:hypothetical protein